MTVFAYYDVLLITNTRFVGVIRLDCTCHGLVGIQPVRIDVFDTLRHVHLVLELLGTSLHLAVRQAQVVGEAYCVGFAQITLRSVTGAALFAVKDKKSQYLLVPQ